MASGKPNGKRPPRERLPRERITPAPRVRMLRTEDIGTASYPLGIEKRKLNLIDSAGPGRPKGSKNRIPARFTEAILAGCERHGEDGEGTNGLEGFVVYMIKNDLKAAAHLIAKIMPQRVQSTVDPQSALGQLLEAARARLQYERSRTITMQSGAVGSVIRQP